MPTPRSFKEYIEYIKAEMPAESPYMYGIHPNAEIGYAGLGTQLSVNF